MKVSMYDKLLELPLFQGLTKENITCIIEKVKMGFHKFENKQNIASQNSKCNNLIFILNGKVKIITTDEKHKLTIEETIEGPYIIEPQSLFGMYTNFHSSYIADKRVETLIIDKNYILSNLCKYDIFNLNYLNILSNRTQTVYNKLFNSRIGDTEEKIMTLLLFRCVTPTGKKTLFVTMEDLAYLINDTRINVSRTLNALQEKNLITLSRKKIIINDIALLTAEIENKQ